MYCVTILEKANRGNFLKIAWFCIDTSKDLRYQLVRSVFSQDMFKSCSFVKYLTIAQQFFFPSSSVNVLG